MTNRILAITFVVCMACFAGLTAQAQAEQDDFAAQTRARIEPEAPTTPGAEKDPDADTDFATHLETIVVKAARTPIEAGSVGSATSVLDSSELKNRQILAISEVLRSRPGLAVSRLGGLGAQSQIRLRGGEANQVAVFIDGIPVNDPAQGNEFNFAHLLNNDIGSIEVIRGPQSALWGSDALSGAINIASARPQPGLNVAVSGEAGSDDYRTFSLTSSYADDELDSAFAISHSRSDGDNIARAVSATDGTTGADLDDGYENTNASLRLNYRFSPTVTTGIRLRYTDASNEFDATDFNTGLLANSDNETLVDQFYGRIFARLTSLDNRFTHQLSINLIDTENENSTENPFATTGFDQTSANSKTHQYSLQSTFKFTPAHQITAALEYQIQRFEQRGPVGFGDPNRDESLEWSSYIAEYHGAITQSLSVLASLRHDDNTDFDNATTGRLSAAWFPFDERTKIRGAYGTGAKNPTFTERFGFFNNFVGNPGLQPEESEGWEIGIDHRFTTAAVELSLTWFDEQLDDEINGFIFDPSIGNFTAGNGVGRSDRTGLELELGWQANSVLELGLAYTYLDATEDDAEGVAIREIRRARHIANARVQWTPSESVSLNLNIDYNGSQIDLFFPPTPPFQERVRLDDFLLVNLTGSYKVNPALTLFGRLENLFNEEYEEVFSFTTPGRAAVFGIRYQAAGR